MRSKMSEGGKCLEIEYRRTLFKVGKELTKDLIQDMCMLFTEIQQDQVDALLDRRNVPSSEFLKLLERLKYISPTNVDPLIDALKTVSHLRAAGILEDFRHGNKNLIQEVLRRQSEKNQVKESDSSRSSSAPASHVKIGKNPQNENQVKESDSSRSSSAPASHVKIGKNPQNEAKKKIFISFSFRNVEIVRKLKDRIEEYIGKDSCWICETGIQGGDRLDGAITQAIDDAEIILCMISNDFVNSGECENEVLLSSGKKKRIIPLLLERVDWPDLKKSNGDVSPMQLAFARRLYVNLYEEEEEEAEFKKLISTIEKRLGLRQQGGNSSQSRPKRLSEGDPGGSIQKKTKAD